MSRFLAAFARDESGATAIEYALIASLVVIVLVTSITALGNKLSGVFNNISTAIPA